MYKAGGASPDCYDDHLLCYSLCWTNMHTVEEWSDLVVPPAKIKLPEECTLACVNGSLCLAMARGETLKRFQAGLKQPAMADFYPAENAAGQQLGRVPYLHFTCSTTWGVAKWTYQGTEPYMRATAQAAAQPM